MLKKFRMIFSTLTLLLALYGLISDHFEYIHIMIMFLGITMLLMGLEEFRKERKEKSVIFLLCSDWRFGCQSKGFYSPD
ncbi:DUF3953 domain-containing protein [Bacillus sp. KH172YL63]|uniref:DUF3953 domain-containing protein n=1 Tax=Bacillus sp. KH172YL63 TaxID=2709784 RepID=UPI00156622D8|nr:DUF3953 domain-containing protein [Bacillus sp. KH172YL63]